MSQNPIHNRLRRIEGQVKKLQQQIDENIPCDQVIPQFMAVRGAVSAALEHYIAVHIESCTAADTEKLQGLIKTLLK